MTPHEFYDAIDAACGGTLAVDPKWEYRYNWWVAGCTEDVSVDDFEVMITILGPKQAVQTLTQGHISWTHLIDEGFSVLYICAMLPPGRASWTMGVPWEDRKTKR